MADNQVPAQDPIVTLYDNLKDEYELSDFDTFKNDLSDPANVSKLHGALAADGFDIPDLDTFSADLGVKKKEMAVDGGDLPEVVVTSSEQSTPQSSQASTSVSVSDQSPLPLEAEPVVTGEEAAPIVSDPNKEATPTSGTPPNPPKLTYKDIEAVLEKSNTLRKKVEENNKLGIKAQEMGWGESWKSQVKQDQDAYNAAQEEKKKVLEQYSRELSRPVDVLIENGEYKKFFNKDGVFDEGKAIAYFQKVSEKYGGGTYLQNQWIVNLKSKAQLEIDKPRFNELVGEEMKNSGINLDQYGKNIFNQLTKDKRATAENLVRERDAQASTIFTTAEGKAKQAATAFDQQVTAINNGIKAGTITYQNAVEQYDQLKKQYDLTIKGLDNGYKDAIRKMNIKVNGKFNRIEEEIKLIGSSIDSDKVFQSLPNDVKKKLQQVYTNAGTRLSEEKNAQAKEKDKNASFLPTSLNIIGKGITSGLNTGLANIGEYLNMKGYSGDFVNTLRSRATAGESFAPAQYGWNKEEWLNRALSSASTSIGASAPILLPTIGALVATGGGAAGAIGSSLVSFAGESAQLGGEQFKESLSQTGDVEEASKKSEQMMKDNMITLPFYFVGGMGDAMIATGKGLRKLATGVALEQLEEVPTEYIQSYNQAVANGYKSGIGAFIKENPEIAADTFVSTIGQSAAMKGFSKALSPLQKLVPNSTTQMLTDVVSKQGVDFANTLIDKWYENGKISKDVVATLKQDVTKIATKIPKLQEAGVNGDKAKLMSSLSSQSEELTTKINAEQDPAVKAVYQNQLSTVNQEINDLIKGQAPYVVFKVPGGNDDTRVMTVREFNALPAESSTDLVKSSDGITVVGDDALNQKLTEQKKQVGNPEDVAPGIYTETVELPEVTVKAGKKLFNDPNPETKVIATEYKQAKGIEVPEGAPITKLDENKSKSIADAYDAMENNPSDPQVKAAYEAMAQETKDQFDAITKAGVKFEIYEGQGEPYKNSEEMIKDVRDNKHLFVLSTEKDFGQNPITDQQRNDNPLLRDSGAKDINGKPLLMNDVFRGVHDFFGHTERGNSFGAVGEENAWDVHARMFTPLARRAMTTETRGQNSWVNFGKQMRNPDGSIKKKGDEGFMSATERPFAEQKIGLLPEEFSNIEDNYTDKSPKFTVTADAPVDLPNVTVSSPIHKKVIADVNQAAKTLASSGVKFKIYDNADSFSSESGQDKSTQGVFVDEDGTVSINLAAINNTNDWNIAWHEASHPVMNIIRNTNRSLYDQMANGLAQLAKTNNNAKAIVNWSENNYEGKETQVDEAMVEAIALMADGTIDFDSVPTGFKQAVIDFVNEIAKYLGLDPLLSDTDKATFIKKAKEISNALKTGTDISEVVGKENIREYQNNLDTPEVVVAGQMKNNPQARISETPAINVYESKETEKLPVRSIEDVYKKFDGKAVAINSDPTRVGELTLPSGKKIFMYGGPAYLSLKDNVDAGVGFATTQPSKVKTWSTYLKSVFGDKDGVTFVTTQAPTSMMANSYSLRYVLDAISTLPKTVLKSKEFKDEFFGKDLVLLKDAFGEKGYNDFVNKYKKADLSDSKVIDGMIAEMAYKVGDDNKPASFKARGAFVGNLLGGIALKADIKGVEGDKGYVSKKPTKFIAKQLFDRLGLNQEKLFYEIGEKSLVDLYMNEGKWGMAVAGFETKAGASIDPAGGVKHPLFNAKFPGSDAFLLDGAYEIDKLFAPQDIISSGGNPYTKSAAQMLAGSMYVMGDKTKGEKSFEYKPSPVSGSKIQQKVGKVELPATTQKQMTEDDKGNYLFYHYSDKNIKKIDPSKFGSNTNATGRDERPGVGISMYYTRPDVKESNVPNEFGYVVRVPKGKVYPFNQDPLNLIEPARRMFEKQYPGQAFDPNKQVAWVSKAAAGRGYPMTVAEWNIGRKKLLRAQTTEALKPEVYSKVKPGTLNQVETNPALEKFKPNAKRAQAKIGGGLSVEDLKDFNSLPNVNLAEGNNYVPLSRFGITDLTGENVKTVAEKLAEVEGPYQPIFKAISKMPKANKVEMYNLGQMANIFNQSGGMVAGLYSPPRTFLDNPAIGIATDIYANQYAATAHEMMHWVTVDSVNRNKGTTEYKALEDIYKFLKAKHPDIVGEKASGAYYGLQNFKEFMAELLTNKDFRDNMAGIMAKDKNEFRDTVYGYNQSTSGDIITTLINYVQKVIRDLMDKWGKGIDFDKSMIDNATDLAVKAFFKDQVGGAQLSKGGANIDADTRKSVANMLGKLSDEDVAKILQDEKGLTEEEAMDLIEDVKYDPTLNPSVEDIVGDLEEGQKARGLSKTFPDRGVDTIAKINDDAKKYFVVSNKQTAEEAQAFIDEKNPEDALDYLLTQPQDIPNRVRIWMSGAVMDKIDTAINMAEIKGDKETAQRLSGKQAQLVNQVAPLGTELGQAIQAFRRFYENSKGSPSMLAFYVKKIMDQVEAEKGKPLTEEERKTITDLAKEVRSANEGLPKDEATYALGNYISSITPVAATDIMEAIWYAHILSGITTQSTNFFANLWNSFAEGAVVGARESLKTRSLMPFINGIQGFLAGAKQGANDAADILKRGVTAQDGDKFKQGNILEFFSWKQVAGEKAGKVLDWAGGFSPNLLKYVGRALAATDAAFARANSEAISRVMAYNIAKEERKANPDMNIKQRVDEILNKTSEKKAEAAEKAKSEGYLPGTVRYRRRVGQILEEGRSKDIKKEADEFGKRVTLNYEPEGFMRPVYKLALSFQQSTKLSRMFLPFTRIVVNLTENALNYTPLGFVKAAVGSTVVDTSLRGNVRRKLTPDERADFAIKATIGLSTFVMLSALTGDDDDDLFEVTANGSGNKQKNYELMKSGWRPYSIKTKDGRYISYKDWPISPILAAVGAMHDSAKYNSSDEPTDEATIAAQAMVVSLYDKSVMKGIQDFAEIINPQEEYNQSISMYDRFKNWGSDQAKTMAISNFTQQAIKFSREAMDSPIKAAKGVERIYRDIPYLNDGLNPILDVFGEPVTPATSEKLLPITIGKPSKDKILAALNENGIYIGKPKTRPLYVSDDPSNEETRDMTDQEYFQYTKRAGQITKQYLIEEWKDVSEILAIPDRKQRRKELKAYVSGLIEDARKEALLEFPNQ